MESEKENRAIRIGDPSDWRLVMTISNQGMEAYLRNTENPMDDVITLLREEWDLSGRSLLERVESTVYDHPQLLDDFSSDIAIVTDQALWIPEKVVESVEDPALKIFRSVYDAHEEDLMMDYVDGKVCVYTLAPGLHGFLQRSFAGARIRCQQSIIVSRFCNRNADMSRVYINMRKGEADFVAFDGKKLLMAVTHEYHSADDISYHLHNLLDVYEINPQDVHVSMSATREMREERGIIMDKLRETVGYVMVTMVPGIAKKAGMSLTSALLMRNG